VLREEEQEDVVLIPAAAADVESSKEEEDCEDPEALVERLTAEWVAETERLTSLEYLTAATGSDRMVLTILMSEKFKDKLNQKLTKVTENFQRRFHSICRWVYKTNLRDAGWSSVSCTTCGVQTLLSDSQMKALMLLYTSSSSSNNDDETQSSCCDAFTKIGNEGRFLNCPMRHFFCSNCLLKTENMILMMGGADRLIYYWCKVCNSNVVNTLVKNRTPPVQILNPPRPQPAAAAMVVPVEQQQQQQQQQQEERLQNVVVVHPHHRINQWINNNSNAPFFGSRFTADGR